jgi:hypothetical protein
MDRVAEVWMTQKGLVLDQVMPDMGAVGLDAPCGLDLCPVFPAL